MKFRTEINIEPSHFQISYKDPIALIGSCFTKNIGKRLQEILFISDINPFGVVYNPLSVKRSLELLMSEKKYSEGELEYYNGKYFSWEHHSDFSGSKPELTLKKINEKIKTSSSFLKTAKYLFISMGTAWVYRLKTTRQVVCNCHKLPAANFHRELLSIEEITEEYEKLIKDLRKYNPEIRIIFTLSPVRHWKDGAHANQISKSVLNIALDNTINKYEDICGYFPSYEILLDDLRDYRFYEEDLLHPNQQAIDYIWEKFSDSYFSKETKAYISKIEKLVRAASHKFFDPGSKASGEFRQKQTQKLEQMKKELPFLDWNELSLAFMADSDL
ncbi:MAG: GSCFA domain-containing protein [Bacteroidota bacterium]